MNDTNTLRRRARMVVSFAFAANACLSLVCDAGELTVKVSGLAEPYGYVGCSLFSSAAGFPMDDSHAKTVWIPVAGSSVICRFKDIDSGEFAASVAHDINENRKLDTNLFGMPTEQWGVSNNVRPTLRAPRLEEAAFSMSSEAPNRTIEIKVKK